ncbi:RNA polymerase factor sigma-54 [Anaerorhabdus sp.]|uniref:RNA polymerase factor sigma-54 n=1 Tax=Anaerorhabdus sp. TaxID=1872524 RepID=UPI002FCC017B
MAQTFLVSPKIKQKIKYSKNQQDSLALLKLSNLTLLKEIKNALSTNPFLQYTSLNDSYIDSLMMAEPSIKDDLISQVNTTRKKINKELCYYIIQSLDEHGFFQENIDDLLNLFSITSNELDTNLTILHDLEPCGIATKNSFDFMLYQLKSRNEDLAYTLLNTYKEEIENSNIHKIITELNITHDEFIHQMDILRSCTIYPYTSTNTAVQTIVPDLFIHIENDELDVQLNELINISLVEIDTKQISEEAKAYLRDAKTLVNNLSFRNFNLMLIANDLFTYQKDYFLYSSPLKKCTLIDVANRTSLHFSTVSRIVNDKYFDYKNKSYPLSVLLCKGISNKSTREIEEAIQSIVMEENPSCPLNDDLLVLALKERGYDIARRTVSKYRKTLNIPSYKVRAK